MERKIIETALICVFFLLGVTGMKVFPTDSLPWAISQCVLVLNFIGASLFLARNLTKVIDAYMDRYMDRIDTWIGR